MSIAVHIAPTRSYSDAPDRPTWKGRLPIDDPHERKEPWQGHSLEEQSQDISGPGNSHPAGQAQSAADAQGPWQDATEQHVEDKELAREGRPRYDETQDPKDAHRRGYTSQEKPVFTRVKALDRGRGFRMRSLADLDNKPQFYTTKNQRLRPINRDLPIDILGKPAHALVLKDAGPRRSKRLEQMEPDMLLYSESPVNLAKLYESTEIDSASSAEVLHNIHELQPTEAVVPRREFEALIKTLHKGFTKAQLAMYISKSSLLAKQKDSTLLQSRSWVLETWPWAPEIEGGGTADALLHGYINKAMSPKEKLAVGLMRQCWGLGIQDLQSQQGYLDVRVQNLQFDLLMRT